MKGIATLNQTLLRGIPSFRPVFEWRAHFRASLPLLAFVKNASILNPSLDLACTEGGVHDLDDPPGNSGGVDP